MWSRRSFLVLSLFVWDVVSLEMFVGIAHTCLLEDTRIELRCFGENNHGQLGYGDETERYGSSLGEALPYIDLGTGDLKIVKVANKAFHTCVLFENGKVKCFGRNGYGQLGLGHTRKIGNNPGEMGENLQYVDFGMVNRFVIDVAVGEEHTCVLFDNKKAKCFGKGGILGNGNGGDIGKTHLQMRQNDFIDFGPKHLKIEKLKCGFDHCGAEFENKKVKLWGENGFGQLGLGDLNTRGDDQGEMSTELPFMDFGAYDKVPVKWYLGYLRTCQVFRDVDDIKHERGNEEVRCVGYNDDDGLLGAGFGDSGNRNLYGNAINEIYDNTAKVLLGNVSKIEKFAMSSRHTCVLFADNKVKCFGRNSYGELGLEDNNSRGKAAAEMGDNLPFVNVTGTSSLKIIDLQVGSYFSCALFETEQVKCWGKAKRNGIDNHIGDKEESMGDELLFLDLLKPPGMLVSSAPTTFPTVAE